MGQSQLAHIPCSNVNCCMIFIFLKYSMLIYLVDACELPNHLVTYDALGHLFISAGDVWFSHRGTIYHNNSCVTLEDIGEENNTDLLCMTNFTACCRHPYSETNLGKWFLPNGTEVLSNGAGFNLYRTRGQMVVRLNRKRGGEEGIYSCEIPDSTNVLQTIYIGVYTANTGEWYMY